MATNILRQYLANTTPNPNRNPFAEGVQTGTRLRQNYLADQALATRRQAGNALAQNDLARAAQISARGGDLQNALALQGRLGQQKRQITEEQQEFGKRFGEFAGNLLKLPEDQRRAAHKAAIPVFIKEAQRLGMDPDPEDFDYDENALRGLASMHGALPDADDDGFTLGPNQARFSGRGRLIAERGPKPDDTDQFEPVSDDEIMQAGFRPGTQAQRNVRTGRIHILQSPSEGSGIRTPSGAVDRQTQQEVRRQASQAFNGRFDPVTQTWSFKNKDEAAQVLELQERATNILAQGEERNIAAATRRALREMRQERRTDDTPIAPYIDIERQGTRNPPPGQSAPAAAPQPAGAQGGASGRQRARNPQTGEVVEFNPQTGQWEPVR